MLSCGHTIDADAVCDAEICEIENFQRGNGDLFGCEATLGAGRNYCDAQRHRPLLSRYFE
jgi:hypothetical protein